MRVILLGPAHGLAHDRVGEPPLNIDHNRLCVLVAYDDTLQHALGVGLLLPFVAGLWGLRAIYLGIMDLSGSLPESWQCRRRCFLRRLTLSWAAVYAAVLPVMIYRLWESFATQLGVG